MVTAVQERVVDGVKLAKPVEEDTVTGAERLLALYPSPPEDSPMEDVIEDMPYHTDAYGLSLLILAAEVVEKNHYDQSTIDAFLQNARRFRTWLHNTSGSTRDVASYQPGGEGSTPPSKQLCRRCDCSGAPHCVNLDCSRRLRTGHPFASSRLEDSALSHSRLPKSCPDFDPNTTESDVEAATGNETRPLGYRESPAPEPSIPDTKLGKALVSDLGPRWAPPRGGKRASRKPRRFND